MRAAADDHATDEPGRRPSAAPAVRPSTVTLPERPPESVRTILDFFLLRFPREKEIPVR
jgi:hypothetical protein